MRLLHPCSGPTGRLTERRWLRLVGAWRRAGSGTTWTHCDNPPVAGVVMPDVGRRRERWEMVGADEAEFEAYAARDGGRLLGFALLLAGDWQDAEDLVQVALLRSAGRWSVARQHPEGYARTVLVNLARDRWRVRRRRHPETLAGDLTQLSPAAAGDAAAAVLDRQLLLRACRLTARTAACGAGAAFLGGPFGAPDRSRAGVHRGHREVPDPPRAGKVARRLAGRAGPGGRVSPGGSTMLTDHDLQAELAAAFREQADPVSGAAVDPAGIFRRAVRRRRRRRAAVRAVSVLAVVAVAAGAFVVSRAGRWRWALLISRLVFSSMLPWPPRRPSGPRSPACRGTTSPPIMADRLPRSMNPLPGKRSVWSGCRAGSTRRCPRSPPRAMTTHSSWPSSPSRGPGFT